MSDFGCTLGEELLKPTCIYSEILHGILRDLPVHGLAHITGGGIQDNLLRIIPKACRVVLKKNSWDVPPIFSFLQKAGKISDDEMLRTFNNGIGLIAVIPESVTEEMLDRFAAMDVKAYLLGEVLENKKSKNRISWE